MVGITNTQSADPNICLTQRQEGRCDTSVCNDREIVKSIILKSLQQKRSAAIRIAVSLQSHALTLAEREFQTKWPFFVRIVAIPDKDLLTLYTPTPKELDLARMVMSISIN
jgi:hypothetical protein